MQTENTAMKYSCFPGG